MVFKMTAIKMTAMTRMMVSPDFLDPPSLSRKLMRKVMNILILFYVTDVRRIESYGVQDDGDQDNGDQNSKDDSDIYVSDVGALSDLTEDDSEF